MLHGVEITVTLSAAFKEAYVELVPQFEGATGHKVTSLWAPSVQIMSRLKEGETVDPVIVSSRSIDELMKLGIVASGKRFVLAQCGVGVAVNAGAPRPDLSSSDLWAAKVTHGQAPLDRLPA